MESTHFRGTANDFSYLVGMTLQNRMPWNTLALNFNTIAPTLSETREIIYILLKELETLHSTLKEKEKLLMNYQKESKSFEENKLTDIQHLETFSESETFGEDIQQQYNSLVDTEIIENAKESINEADVNSISSRTET